MIGPAMTPKTRYARAEGLSIAYQVFGQGDLDLVVIPGWVSNVEMFWEEPNFARFLNALASFARVLIFDKRGTGLSERISSMPLLEERIDDLRAVMDAAGSRRAALLGYSEGGPMSLLFAATYPDVVSHVILIGSYPRRLKAPDFHCGIERTDLERRAKETEEHWGEPLRVDGFFPSRKDDPAFRNWWSRFLRLSATGNSAAAVLRANIEIDVRHLLGSVRVPTLVLHAKGDRVIPVEAGRYMADRIPGARFAELPSEDHLPWLGGLDTIPSQVQEFLTGSRATPGDSMIGTILVTDIVGSTRIASERGDRHWADLRSAHHARIRAELSTYRGREINETGDGMLALFDGPARALRCAFAVREAVASLGLSLRLGVHTGECEIRDGDVSGLALHIAARVAALAPPDTVLASRTVKDLVAGSTIRFDDFGRHSLKGVPDEWQLYKVRAPQ
jgi:pimeloyl-ACP methyl ester carboxylesterase/class 3 adenylate cyclase